MRLLPAIFNLQRPRVRGARICNPQSRSFPMPSESPRLASRRQFLKTTGAVAAATAVAHKATPAVHAAEDNKIQIALVGCGGRGNGAATNALSVESGPIFCPTASRFNAIFPLLLIMNRSCLVPGGRSGRVWPACRNGQLPQPTEPVFQSCRVKAGTRINFKVSLTRAIYCSRSTSSMGRK